MLPFVVCAAALGSDLSIRRLWSPLLTVLYYNILIYPGISAAALSTRERFCIWTWRHLRWGTAAVAVLLVCHLLIALAGMPMTLIPLAGMLISAAILGFRVHQFYRDPAPLAPAFPFGRLVGDEELVQAFPPAQLSSAAGAAPAPDGSWRIEGKFEELALFELPLPRYEQCLVLFRAQVRSDRITGKVHFTMYCRVEETEYVSKDVRHPFSPDQDWTEYELPFYLRPGQLCESVRLCITCEGTATVWVRQISLFRAPLSAPDPVPAVIP